MIDFNTYLLLQIFGAAVGVVIGFPLAIWWLKHRQSQREMKAEKHETQP